MSRTSTLLNDAVIAILTKYHDEYGQKRIAFAQEIAKLERQEIGLYNATWIYIVWFVRGQREFRYIGIQVSYEKWRSCRPRIDSYIMESLFGGLHAYQKAMNRSHREPIMYCAPKRGATLPYRFQF